MFSISRVSSIFDLPVPVTVCCHDAGGANLIAAWVAEAAMPDLRVCAGGPAREIFAGATPERAIQELPAALDGAASLLSGSGWSSDLEHRARVEARSRGLLIVAVLDHWVNYRMRFIRDGQQSMPDVLVVTDAAAAALAAETFGDACRIELWENSYLRREVQTVHSIQRQENRASAPHLLVLLEPVRNDWLEGATQTAEFRCLDYLIEHLGLLFPNPESVQIRLRPHPSELPGKYLSWLARQSRRDARLSTSASLAQDIAWADVAAGLNSYALVVALESGRRAVSYLPQGAPPCVLRDARLEMLAPPRVVA